eukprot:scaffold2801_cov161-Ochromonas_danica.AAC.2
MLIDPFKDTNSSTKQPVYLFFLCHPSRLSPYVISRCAVGADKEEKEREGFGAGLADILFSWMTSATDCHLITRNLEINLPFSEFRRMLQFGANAANTTTTETINNEMVEG